MSRRTANLGAVSSLILSRIVYAVNWYNIASVFSVLALDFNETVSGLGVISGSFYLGIGLFQIPGGILATELGPRKTATLGTTVASVAALLCGVASEFYQITILRFLVGLGMALVFASGVTLMAKYFRKGAEGLGVGFFNSAFYVGGALGLFVWAILGHLIGWRSSLLLGGAMGVATAILLVIFVPSDSRREEFRFTSHGLRETVLNKSLLITSLALLAISVGTTVVGSFVVFYLEDSLELDPAIAGMIGSLLLLFALPASPIAGRVFDRTKDARKLLAFSGIAMALGIVVAGIHSIYAAALSTIIVGLSSGVAYTVGFSFAREANRLESEYETLAISWVNSISLSAAFWSPLAFGQVAIRFGYASAWLASGLFTLLLVLPVLWFSQK